jgi:ketosteroid isomerase-like protein
MTDNVVNGNVEVVLATFRAVEQRDVQALLDLYHPEIEFHDALSLPYGGVVTGKPAVEEHTYSAVSWAATWGPLQPMEAERRMDPRVVAASADEVVVLYRQRAVSAAGECLDAPVLGLYQVRDGKLTRAQMFHFDTAAIVGFLARANSDAAARPADVA